MKTLILFLTVFFIGFTSCKTKKKANAVTSEPCVVNTNENCMCIEIYDPVCGCNNKTYSNSCHAECSGVTYVKGICKDKK